MVDEKQQPTTPLSDYTIQLLSARQGKQTLRAALLLLLLLRGGLGGSSGRGPSGRGALIDKQTRMPPGRLRSSYNPHAAGPNSTPSALLPRTHACRPSSSTCNGPVTQACSATCARHDTCCRLVACISRPRTAPPPPHGPPAAAVAHAATSQPRAPSARAQPHGCGCVLGSAVNDP